MRGEIIKSEYKVYYSRIARAYYVIIMDVHHYWPDRKSAQVYCNKMEAKLLGT
jgi:hypothetical protein